MMTDIQAAIYLSAVAFILIACFLYAEYKHGADEETYIRSFAKRKFSFNELHFVEDTKYWKPGGTIYSVSEYFEIEYIYDGIFTSKEISKYDVSFSLDRDEEPYMMARNVTAKKNLCNDGLYDIEVFLPVNYKPNRKQATSYF